MRVKIGTFIGVVIIAAVLVLHSINPFAHAASMVTTDGPPGNPSAWTLAFQDDFTAPTLNASTWSTCYWWSIGANGCAGPNGELERYLPQNVGVHDGLLDLQALRQPYALNGKNYAYTSGMVSSAGKYSFLYGYMEARIKVPAGQGYWPAFWSLAEDHTRPTELDTMELLGNDPHTIYVGAHYADSKGVHKHQGSPLAGGPDFSADFHTVGVDWAADHLTFYVDGVAKYSVTNGAVIPQRALYLILNLAVGGTWPGAPDGTTAFPGHYLVDWVRVWQHNGTQPAPTTVATAAPTGTVAPAPTASGAAPTPTAVAITPATPIPPTPVPSGTPAGTNPIFVTQSGFTTHGISDDQTTTQGDLDGFGDSYSAQALATAGITPGTALTSDGVQFLWPSTVNGQADNYLVQSQPFGVVNAQQVRTVGFLGLATGQAASGDGLMTFTDGTTQPFTLHFDDWTLNGGTTHLTTGNRIVATMPYHNTANGAHTEATMLFAAHVTVPAGKTLRNLTLPAATLHGHLHIFTIGTDAGPVTTLAVGALWGTFAGFFGTH